MNIQSNYHSSFPSVHDIYVHCFLFIVQVDLVGYAGSSPPVQLISNSSIRIKHMKKPPSLPFLPKIVQYLIKAILQVCAYVCMSVTLFWVLNSAFSILRSQWWVLSNASSMWGFIVSEFPLALHNRVYSKKLVSINASTGLSSNDNY